MYWKITREAGAEGVKAGPPTGRFVLHRHRDAEGPHLDLRLESDGFLLGWRIEGGGLEEERWAEAKGPHPLAWLDDDRDAVRVDAGTYYWLEGRPGQQRFLLLGAERQVVCVEREPGLPLGVVRSVCAALDAAGVESGQAARLVRDGIEARRRAIERFCGLGRELDGDTFDESVWRKALDGLSLDEVHGQLRAFEVRFDQKYPPEPVSQPEALDAEERADVALAIAREG